MNRVFVATASARSGSTILSWLISQHSFLKNNPIYEHYFISKKLNEIINSDINQCVKCIDYYDNNVNKSQSLYSGAKLLNLNAFTKLRSTFPNDYILNLVRNPFDWYYSCKTSVKSNNPHVIDPSVAWWFTKHIKPSMHNFLKCNNIKLIYFEDIINHTDQTVADIFNFLNFPLEDINVDAAKNVYSVYTSHKIDIITDGLQKSVINKGINELPSTDISAITDIINKDEQLMKIFGRYFNDL